MAYSHHGSTPAAWTAVCIALLAFVVGGVGLVIGSWLTFWIAVGIFVLSGVVGKVMQAMGMGAH
ncbi:MAG: HGxxPAAW family protein [Nocardioidaceae bacterium]